MKPFPLGDMPLETFLSEYWQKKPLLIHNALPDFNSPVAPDVLAGLACEEGVESRLVIQGHTEQEWELKHGPFNDDIFSQLPESHWTLLVQAVDHWVPEAGNLLNMFDFIPRWRIDDLMISYASDGGGVGPQHCYLKDIGRVKYVSIDDNECLDAFMTLSRIEGIIPALESAHAVAYAMKIAKDLGPDKTILINLSGRGDKDVDFVAEKLGL